MSKCRFCGESVQRKSGLHKVGCPNGAISGELSPFADELRVDRKPKRKFTGRSSRISKQRPDGEWLLPE